MAAPSFNTAIAGATDAGGAWLYSCSNLTAGIVVILQVLQDGATAGAATLTGVPSFRENLAGTDSAMTQIPGPLAGGAWAVGGSAQAHQYLWIGRSTGAGIGNYSGGNSTSEDLYIREYSFADVSTGTTLATVIENGGAGLAQNEVGTSATANDCEVITLGPDRLALNFVAVNDDNAISAFSGETGGNWVLPTSPYADAGGTDGAIALQASYLFDVEVISFPEGSASPEPFGDTTTLRRGQSFVAPSTASSWTVGVELDAFGSPTDDVQLDLYADSSGPTGASLGSSAPLDVSGTGLKMYTPTISASLVSGTTYWIVASRTGAQNASNFYRWSRGTIAYAGGSGADDTGTWAIGGNDMSFGISAGDTTGTIDGGTGSIVDIDSWGVVGFALIGTTVATAVYVPRYGFVNHQNPGIV